MYVGYAVLQGYRGVSRTNRQSLWMYLSRQPDGPFIGREHTFRQHSVEIEGLKRLKVKWMLHSFVCMVVAHIVGENARVSCKRGYARVFRVE